MCLIFHISGAPAEILVQSEKTDIQQQQAYLVVDSENPRPWYSDLGIGLDILGMGE